MPHGEVVVIGAGIAGASVAALLARETSVIVLEAEDQPGHHATGRSAAMFLESYGPPPVRAATRASRAFFEAPPDRFSLTPLVRPRGMLTIADEAQCDRLAADFAAGAAEMPGLTWLDGAAARQVVPALAPGRVVGATHDVSGYDLDVAALHQGYLRMIRGLDGRLLTGARADTIAWTGGHWRVETRAGPVEASILIDAAGAWADPVAEAAGAAPLGIAPQRRTAVLAELADWPPGADDWPLVADCDETFYFKPESGRLLLSPADRTPAPPGDARPEEEDVATAIHRVETATTLRVRRLQARWAGLRSAAPDGVPVVGWDAARRDGHEAFLWLAGQGGYGIQTAPAFAELASALALDRAPSGRLADCGADACAFAPARFDRDS